MAGRGHSRMISGIVCVVVLFGLPVSPFSNPCLSQMPNVRLRLRDSQPLKNAHFPLASSSPCAARSVGCMLRLSMTTAQAEQDQGNTIEISQTSTLPWPDAGQGCSPVHVRFVPKGKGNDRTPMEKLSRKPYEVFVNDTQKRTASTGITPLSIIGDGRKETQNNFALLGDFRADCPSYLHYLPPVSNENTPRLWVTSFGMARMGGVIGVDLTGTLPPRICKAPFVWPNAVEFIPEGALDGVRAGSILVADGFLVPGKNDGNVWLVEDPGGAQERAVMVTPKKKTFFYHRAIPLSINGHQGILTARACKPINPFLPAVGELVWLEKPATLDPLAEWNLPWREIVLAEGPDVMFEVVDLDESDSTVEIFAAEFFAQRLTLHSLAWDERTKAPKVVQRDVLDDTLGQAYCVAVGDLEGPRSHLLVTTHEDLPVQASTGSKALSFLSGRQSWSYTRMQTPKDCRELKPEEEVIGGSLFAYEIPERWRAGASVENGQEAFRLQLQELYRRLDSGQGVAERDLQAAILSLGVEVASEEVQKMFQDADWDESGALDYQEFEQLMVRARNSAKPVNALVRAVSRALELPQNALEQSKNAVRELESKLPASNTVLAEEEFISRLPDVFAKFDEDGSGAIDMKEMHQAMMSMGVSCTNVELASMFIEADLNGDGKVDWAEFRSLLTNMYRQSIQGVNVWTKALSSLEKALSVTAGMIDGSSNPAVWRRRTLASGFQVKRVGINPGAPGFVYAFHPHAELRDQKAPPHLLLAGDCADAAYVFRPARGTSGELNYELMATFGCEGTVGSIGVGWGDTLQSIDDGWVKFFVPVYEENRVYMIKCGGSNVQRFTPDDEW